MYIVLSVHCSMCSLCCVFTVLCSVHCSSLCGVCSVGLTLQINDIHYQKHGQRSNDRCTASQRQALHQSLLQGPSFHHVWNCLLGLSNCDKIAATILYLLVFRRCTVYCVVRVTCVYTVLCELLVCTLCCVSYLCVHCVV